MYKMFILYGSMGTGAYCINLSLHTVFLERYRKTIATYRTKREIPVTKVHQQWLKEVMRDLKLPENTRKLIKPFNIRGLDLYHAGTLDFQYGAILGLPVNFSYKDVNTMNKSDILLKGKVPNWENIDGQRFLESLILSENAQKFAMAREILRLQNGEPRIYARNLGYLTMALLLASAILRQRLRLNEARPIFRYAVYWLLSFVVVGSRILYKNYHTVKFDAENDNALAEMGLEYIRGGQEFYEKLLQRNIALRKLLGEEGEKLYTAMGNEIVFLRQGGIPLYDRKCFFDKKLENTGQPMPEFV